MVARQHPGEAMAEWFVEGFLNRLTDPHDAAAMRVLEHAVFYVVSLIPLLKLLGRKQRAAWVVHEPFLNLAWWLSRFFSPLVKLLQPVKLSQLVTLLQTDKKSTTLWQSYGSFWISVRQRVISPLLQSRLALLGPSQAVYSSKNDAS